MIAFHVNYTKFYILYFYMYYFTCSLFKLGIHILLISIQIVYFLILSFICLYIDQILQIEISYVCYLLKSMEIVKMLTIVIFDVTYDKRVPMVTRNFNDKQANCQFSNENQNIHVLKNNQIKYQSFSNVSQLVYMT